MNVKLDNTTGIMEVRLTKTYGVILASPVGQRTPGRTSGTL